MYHLTNVVKHYRPQYTLKEATHMQCFQTSMPQKLHIQSLYMYTIGNYSYNVKIVINNVLNYHCI